MEDRALDEKRCSKCNSRGPFIRDNRLKSGFGSICLECKRAHDREYGARNRDKNIAKAAAWNSANKERRNERLRRNYNPDAEKETRNRLIAEDPSRKDRRNERSRAWKRENADKVKESARRYQQNNLEKHCAKQHKRRAKIAKSGGSYTLDEWSDLRREYGNTCIVPGCKNTNLEPDHVIPVSKGGTSDISNIQPLCRFHNRSKGTKVIDYRRKTSGR